MEQNIDITGIDPGVLLAALHNNTKAIGMGRLHDKGRSITRLEALAGCLSGGMLAEQYPDYLCGPPHQGASRCASRQGVA